MKRSSRQFAYAIARAVAAVALVASMTFAPGMVLALDKGAPAVDKGKHQERIEMRIKDMHAKLKITQAQEEQWAKVSEVMRDNAKAMDALTQARLEHSKTMSAVDDLKSYGEITEAHADGIKRFTPVFATLYESMSDGQKKDADVLFRHGDHKKGDKNADKNRDKMSRT